MGVLLRVEKTSEKFSKRKVVTARRKSERRISDYLDAASKLIVRLYQTPGIFYFPFLIFHFSFSRIGLLRNQLQAGVESSK